MPLTIVFEWVGGVFAKSLFDRLLYLGLFLGLFWLSDLSPRGLCLRGFVRRAFGVLALGLGAALFYVAARWLLANQLGLAPFVPPPWAEEKHRLLAPLVAAWPLALASTWLRERETSARVYEQLGLWLAVGFLLHVAAGVRVQALPVTIALSPYALLGLFAVPLALIVVWRGPFALRLAALLLAGFAFRTLGILAWEIDPRVRDMLALVMSAEDRFVAGENPYAIYAMQRGSELPLTYFPGLWLGYGVPRLFGLDLRFMGPLLELGALSVLGLVTRQLEGERRAWGRAFVMCFAAVWLFSPSVQWNAVYAEPNLWWGLLGCALALTYARHFRAAALLFGCALATRHFAVVLAPFVLLYFVRVRGLRGALPYLAITGGVAALLLTPFVWADAELFWFGTFRWLREYGPAHLAWFFDRFGFMAWFHEHGAFDELPLAQWGMVGVCFLGALLAPLAWLPAFAATAQLSFIMLNVLLWDSFLLDGAMAAACVVVTRPLVRNRASLGAPASSSAAPGFERALSPRVLRASAITLAVAALAAAYLGFTLYRRVRPRGGEALRDYAVRSVEQGDFVIDRSDRRLAFVFGSWLLRRDEVPAPIGGELYDGAWGGGPALHSAGRIWLITDHARDRVLRPAFARLGRVLERRRFGDFELQVLAPHAMRLFRLARVGEGVTPRHCGVGPTDWQMASVDVSAERPARVTLGGQELGRSLLLAGGFPNDEVEWPRQSVTLSVEGLAGRPQARELVLENLRGMQWQTFDTRELAGQAGEVTVTVRTQDPGVRTVCLELLALDRRPKQP